ncbi:hypothetical protein AGABI1DRAFT_49846, partial [Agaricus bisporus var. burnettii JB137-S8]
IIFTPGRTHNRSRSPRSVTSGKGLALRVGCVGPWLEASGPSWDCLGGNF